MQGLFHFGSAKNSCPMNQLDGKKKLTVCAFKVVEDQVANNPSRLYHIVVYNPSHICNLSLDAYKT
jgi:hypothetical protein